MAAEKRSFYPETEPYNKGHFTTHDGHHQIYFEESGNKTGLPVIFLHGGPGAGTDHSCRKWFNPSVYRIVLIDQRGSGQSTPHASLVENTTWKLIEDIEQLRDLLNIEKWVVFGGSWGSTISLAYSISHPDRVLALILRGIFLVRKKEVDWFYENGLGANFVYPDAWDKYLDFIPKEEHDHLVAAYYKRMTSDNYEEALEACKMWSVWEASCSKMVQDPALMTHFAEERFAYAFSRIECHYFTNGGFWPTDNWIIENVDKIKNIPMVIAQGRHDLVCPMRSAYDLVKALRAVGSEPEFHVCQLSGHSAAEADITQVLLEATEKFTSLAQNN